VAQNLTFNLAVDTNSAVSSINQFFNSFDQGAAKAKNQLNQAFGQTLQTNVEINLKNGELVARKVQNINQESKKLEQATKAINGEFAKTPNALKRQLSILKQLQGDTQKYQTGTRKLTSDWQLVTQRIREASKELKVMTQGGPLQQMKAALTGIVGKFALVQTAANLATSMIQNFVSAGAEFADMAGRMEVLSLQMEAFTGSTEESEAAFRQFVDIAAKTPFNLEQVAQAGKIMMAFGVDTNTAVKATEQLGIVAAATGGDINLLARNLGQIAAQGQAYTRDLTQFAIQGIPIWEEMSKVTGKSVAELKKMASEGQISFSIVSEALDNLTAKGGKFAEIAERMQETFQGRMARIEASVNLLAKEFVATFNKMDQALGGIVSGSMKAFADGLQWIANNFDGIAIAIGTATAATVAFMTVSNWGAIVGGIRLVVGAIQAIVTWQNLANAATIVFHALAGNWAGIAAAVAVGAAAYAGLNAAMNKAAEDAGHLDGAVEGNIDSVNGLSDAQKKLAEDAGIKDLITDYENLKGVMDEKKAALDKEIEVLEALKGKVKEKYDAEIQGIKDTIAEDKIKQDEMKQAHDDRLAEINQRYDAELELIDLAIGKLREKTESEQKLYDMEKQKLRDKIKSGELDGEELLRAKSRLERMENQEKIAELLREKAEKQAEKEREIDDAKKEQNDRMDEMQRKIQDQEGEIRKLEKAREDEIKTIDDAIDAAEGMTDEIDLTNVEVSEQIGLVKNLATEYANAKSQVDAMGRAIDNAIAKQRILNAEQNNGGSSNSGARASGGPVSGGSTYTVNELGKEAFLSASGKLSMINAPAFGDWKAPGSGTVIPAHLTKQLNIPTGGVNLNSTASSNAARAGAGGMGSMIRAIQAGRSGDTFNQSVTVQSSNPTKTASDMLVSLNRLRRRR